MDKFDDLIERWEAEYTRLVRLLAAARISNPDYRQWATAATQLQACLEDLHKALGRECPEYGSKLWRLAAGVSS